MSAAGRMKLQPDILVVDDDDLSRKVLEGYLRTEGYLVRTAAEGATALELASTKAPDVVLLDVMMPGMTGHQVCQALKSHPETRLSQVMMVTALDGTSDKVHGLDTGADDYVTKPVRREEFLAKVRALVRARLLLVELEKAREQLATRNEELELKKTLAQTLVHDLKNPLTAVLGNLELVDFHVQGNDMAAPFLERCRLAVGRMQKMILDLLDVEGLEEGRYVLQPCAVDLAQVAAGAAEEAAAAARQREVYVGVESSGGRCIVEGDPAVLRRVVDNMIANGIEHSPEGGRVTVSAAPCPEGVEISVTDQGTGVPEQYRESIFEKYSRLDLRGAGMKANRGLGLTFCRLAVEGHGGTIWVDDAPGGGARFRALFPACDRPAQGEADGSAEIDGGLATATRETAQRTIVVGGGFRNQRG